MQCILDQILSPTVLQRTFDGLLASALPQPKPSSMPWIWAQQPGLVYLTRKKKTGKANDNSDKESGSQKPSEGWIDRQSKHSKMRSGWESYNILPWGQNTSIEAQ